MKKNPIMEKISCICETFIADITSVKCPIHGVQGPLDAEKAEGFYRLCMDMTWGDWFEDDEKESPCQQKGISDREWFSD